MNFSENLVRHLYVLNEVSDATTNTNFQASTLEAEGAAAIRLTDDKQALYIQHMGKGGLTRTDLIPVCNLLYANLTKATAMLKPLKKATILIALDIDADGEADTTVPRGVYIVRITINNYIGMSDEDTYIKYGQVTSNGTMSTADFYASLKKSLEKNMSRETTKMFEIGGGTSNVTITEVEQPWVRGRRARTSVNFEVELVSNDEMFEISTNDNVTTYDWGTVTMENSSSVLKNGKEIADLEYFCMGERADLYRGIGYPNNIETAYMVDPSKEYDVLDIHYAYVGSNESVQKSEKTLTLVALAGSDSALDTVVTALESVTKEGFVHVSE